MTGNLAMATVLGLFVLGAHAQRSALEEVDIKDLPVLEKLNASGSFERNIGFRWGAWCKYPVKISSQLVRETKLLPAQEGKGYLQVKMTGGVKEHDE